MEELTPPTKSLNDAKQYRVVRLQNGITALLISDSFCSTDEVSRETVEDSMTSVADAFSDKEDEETDHSQRADVTVSGKEEKMAAVGLCVGVGSFSDPENIQGLAHFLEHMVFMGSEKYPGENEFDVYLKARGGSTNASTELEYTTFYFDCHLKYLESTMERFAHFFISPLLNREAMQREREAVNSEFKAATPSDSTRRSQLLTSLAEEGHPASKFSWGNIETLKGRVTDDELYKALHEFRSRHYSAHRMTLAVQASMPLEVLTDLVSEYFSQIPTNNLPPEDFSVYSDRPFDTPDFYRLYHVKPVKNICILDLTWALPPMMQHYKSKPCEYLASVLQNGGNGSLLHYLRSKLWALDILAGTEDGFNGYTTLYTLFGISIQLTDSGEKNLIHVVTAVFDYLNMVRTKGPSKEYFKELKTIRDTGFQYAEEVDAAEFVEAVVEDMQFFPPEHFITGSYLFFTFDRQGIQQCMDYLLPHKANIMIMSQCAKIEYDRVEKWFKTPYKVENIPHEWISSWAEKAASYNFSLPPPNIFITTDFSLIETRNNKQRYPVKILQDKYSEVWFLPDNRFRLPIAYFEFNLMTPVTSLLHSSIMLDLYVSTLEHRLVPELFSAEQAYLLTSLHVNSTGIGISVNGYSQNLYMIVDIIAKHMAELAESITEGLFQALHKDLYKTYWNMLSKPGKLCKDLQLSTLVDTYWTTVDKVSAINTISFSTFRRFCKDVLRHVYVQSLVQGNISEENANSVSCKFYRMLRFYHLARPNRPVSRMCQIPPGEHTIRVKSCRENDETTIVMNYYQLGLATLRDYCMVDLVVMLMEEPLFNVLRTKEQLGYHVCCALTCNKGILGMTIRVNAAADKYSADYVDNRISSFIDDFTKSVSKMSNKSIDRTRRSLMKLKQGVDVNLYEEVNRNWGEIISGEYAFDHLEKEVACIADISSSDVKRWLRRQLVRAKSQTPLRKLSVQIIGSCEFDQEKGFDMHTMCEDSMKRVVPPRLQFQNEPNNSRGQMFITDIPIFKQELFTFPIHKIYT